MMYQNLGVGLWQLWIHEENHDLGAIARAAGLAVDTTTMTMAMDLTKTNLEMPTSLDIIRDPGVEDLRGLLYHADVTVPQLRACGAAIYASRSAGQPASCVVSFDHNGDRGIYMVETAERFRRRGLARALTVYALWEGRERGCTSSSLQATEMAERVYASMGFQPMGRYVEWQYRG